MKREYLVKMRGGSEHLAYPGLLDLAHEQGLVSIDTEMRPEWIPTPENGMRAIVKAIVTMNDPDDSVHLTRYYTAHGDASPENVGRNIQPHIIRMAETRAKARALRDAVNIGAVDFEESQSSAENVAENPADDAPVSSRNGDEVREPSSEKSAKTAGGASRRAANYLYGILRRDTTSEEERKNLKEWVGSLSQDDVSWHLNQHQERGGEK